jgi:hypothetical protein
MFQIPGRYRRTVPGQEAGLTPAAPERGEKPVRTRSPEQGAGGSAGARASGTHPMAVGAAGRGGPCCSGSGRYPAAGIPLSRD